MKADRERTASLLARWLVCALALAVVQVDAWAAKAADFGKNIVASNGKTTTIYPMGSLTPNAGGSLIPVTPTVGGWTATGNYGFPSGPTAPTIGVNYKGQFADGSSPTGQAMKYPYTANSKTPVGDIAKAVGTLGCSILSGGAAALACAVAVPLVMDWIKNSDGRLNPDTGALERKDPGTCSVGPCYEYQIDLGPMLSNWGTIGSVCAQFADMLLSANGAGWTYSTAPNASGTGCTYQGTGRDNSWHSGERAATRRSAPTTAPGWLPASLNDIAPYMSTRPVTGELIGEIISKGGDLPLGTPTITGPSSIKGPETTTINADGSRTVTSTTNNYTTAGNTVTNNSSVTTTTTYNTDNSVRSTTSTTTVPTEESEKEDACKENPNRLGCAELDTPEGTIPKETKTITYSEESVLGGGSCPADVFWSPQSISGSYKFINWQQACGWALSLKWVVLLLATWAAFWIVMPGNSQVKPQ